VATSARGAGVCTPASGDPGNQGFDGLVGFGVRVAMVSNQSQESASSPSCWVGWRPVVSACGSVSRGSAARSAASGLSWKWVYRRTGASCVENDRDAGNFSPRQSTSRPRDRRGRIRRRGRQTPKARGAARSDRRWRARRNTPRRGRGQAAKTASRVRARPHDPTNLVASRSPSPAVVPRH
jgi:hypothetical protein